MKKKKKINLLNFYHKRPEIYHDHGMKKKKKKKSKEI